MRESDDLNSPRPRPRKKSKKRSLDAGRRLVLRIGGAVGALLLIILVIWIVSRGGGLGSSGAVVAEARPAEPDPNSPTLPPETVPAVAPGWKVTPDGAPLASGLAAAIPLPEGHIGSLLFADPARARAAVVLAKPAVKPKQGGPKDAVPQEWLRIDLKAGRVVERIALGDSHPFSGQSSLHNAALSPSGDRLAVILPDGGGTLQVWGADGKKIQELSGAHYAFGEWLAFVGEDRLLFANQGKLSAIEVSSGQPAYTIAGKVRGPIALSPSRKWVCATSPADDITVYATADGSVAGRWPKVTFGGFGVKALAFHPDGATLSAMFNGALFSWDVASGKPVRAVRRQIGGTFGHEANHILCLGPRYMLFGDYLFDAQLNLGLWRYRAPERLHVVRGATPDGRLWIVGSYKQVFALAKTQPGKLNPGPIADDGAKGVTLLAAFTVPHPEVAERLDKARAGIVFPPGGPIRIEVTGEGTAEQKRLVARGAAEAAAKRGIAVDPAATVGVRIELTAMRTARIVYRSPGSPPVGSVPDNPKEGRIGNVLESKVRYFNSKTNGLSKSDTLTEHRAFPDDADWETKLFTGIGKRVGESQIPPTGYYDAEGQDVGLLGLSIYGIDGVLEPMPTAG
jgi:hypothetical protein